MQILVDADALPRVVKDILYRAANRRRIRLTLVADQELRVPESDYIATIRVTAGPDAADDRIVELVKPGDLVVTADIPLADRVVSAGACALDPRGTLHTDDTVKQRLAMRDLMTELRSAGMLTGGPAPIDSRNVQAFANQLDRFLARQVRA
jgi:uncharacterized protein